MPAGQKPQSSLGRLTGYGMAAFNLGSKIKGYIQEKKQIALADRVREAKHALDQRFLATEDVREYTSYAGALGSEAEYMARHGGENSPLADQIFKNAGAGTASAPATTPATVAPATGGPVTPPTGGSGPTGGTTP